METTLLEPKAIEYLHIVTVKERRVKKQQKDSPVHGVLFAVLFDVLLERNIGVPFQSFSVLSSGPFHQKVH